MILVLLVSIAMLAGQAPPPQPRPARPTDRVDGKEALALAAGWEAFATGRAAEAAKKAADVLAAFPRSGAARILAHGAEVEREQASTPAGGRPPVKPDEAAAIAAGWRVIAKGEFGAAANRAAQVLSANPRSGGGLMLAVEAEIGRGGPGAGLKSYETWLGPRTREEPAVLRRLAQATLRQDSADRAEPAARIEALRALAADGDDAAAAELAQEKIEGSSTSSRALAAVGNEEAAKALIADLERGIVDVRTIDALGASGSKLAAPALTQQLKDPRSYIRAAAADALGRLADPELVARLKPLLSDPSGLVRLKAAGALVRLGDFSGAPIIQEQMADASPGVRLAAAEAMASRPDGSWTALVTELTTVSDPEVQANAARLLAPHDPARAAQVLEALSTHENPAIRELAARAMADAIPNDLAGLRRLLRHGTRLTRVRAAARVLDVTR